MLDQGWQTSGLGNVERCVSNKPLRSGDAGTQSTTSTMAPPKPRRSHEDCSLSLNASPQTQAGSRHTGLRPRQKLSQGNGNPQGSSEKLRKLFILTAALYLPPHIAVHRQTGSLSWSATTTLSNFSALIFCVNVTT